MEDEQREDPVVKHCILTWDIVNFLMALTKETYVIESPIFSFADCCWSLKFFAEHIHDSNGGLCLGVYLCRRWDENIEPCWDEIRATTSIVLKTPSEQVIAKGEVRNSFARGGFSDLISHVTTWQNVSEALGYLPEDTLVIVCDVIVVVEYYDPDYCLSDAKKILSSDMRQLLNTPGNSHLLTRDGRKLPVHKEILSAHSPVFRAQFMSGFGCLLINFSEEVVGMMLKFIYSGRIGHAIGYDVPSPELYDCALEYGIFGLQRLLTPENVHASTVITCWTESIPIRFPRFAESLSMEQREANDPLSNICLTLGDISIYENNVRGQLSSTFDHEKAKVRFKMELRHTMNGTAPRAIGMCADYYLVDNLGSYKGRMRTLSDFDDQGRSELEFELEVEKLFANEYVLFPNDTLEMLCEFKLLLDDGFSSGPDSWHFTIPSEHERLTFDLDATMRYLLKSQIFADVTLTLKSNERFRFRVHRSVMSARSPYFRELLEDGRATICLSNNILSVKAAKALVLYIYTGNLTFCCDSLILLFISADNFEISNLRADCSERLRLRPLTHRSVFKKYRFASVSSNEVLRNLCQDFILKNKDLILGTTNWDTFKLRNSNLALEILALIRQNARAF